MDYEFYFQNRDKVIGKVIHWPIKFLERDPDFVEENENLITMAAPLKIITWLKLNKFCKN